METDTMQEPSRLGRWARVAALVAMLAGVVACGGGSSAGSTPPLDTVVASTVRVHYKRVIPCLDVDRGRVVKGIGFVDLRDAGDPVELASRYDAAGADELVFLDITATSDKRDTVVKLARQTAGADSSGAVAVKVDSTIERVVIRPTGVSRSLVASVLQARRNTSCG